MCFDHGLNCIYASDHLASPVMKTVASSYDSVFSRTHSLDSDDHHRRCARARHVCDVANAGATDLPNPLLMPNGQLVTAKNEWLKKQRPQLKAMFEHYMYGQMPARPSRMQFSVERVDRGLFSGKATEKEITIVLGTNNAPQIHLLLVAPNHRSKPAPVFVGLNFCGNHTVLADPVVSLRRCGCPRVVRVSQTIMPQTQAGGAQVDTWGHRTVDRPRLCRRHILPRRRRTGPDPTPRRESGAGTPKGPEELRLGHARSLGVGSVTRSGLSGDGQVG